MAELYIGLMSGTSLDGVDGVLADFSTTPLRVRAHAALSFDPAFRARLLALNTERAEEERLAGETAAAQSAKAPRKSRKKRSVPEKQIGLGFEES